MAELLRTERLLLRDWTDRDAEAALTIYPRTELSRWLGDDVRGSDAGSHVEAMRTVLRDWAAAQRTMTAGHGRWAIALLDDDTPIGAITLLPMPVPEADVEIGYRLAPGYQRKGYATEAGRALADWAFRHSLVEVFALVAPENASAAATARRIGMEWVGESDKYHGSHLEVYRLRPDDLAHVGSLASRA
jgi:RimJ/RimL family protein N-acetyltransferase